jgi:hypothetical protein
MARYFEFLSQFYGFHLTHPRIFFLREQFAKIVLQVGASLMQIFGHLQENNIYFEDTFSKLESV